MQTSQTHLRFQVRDCGHPQLGVMGRGRRGQLLHATATSDEEAAAKSRRQVRECREEWGEECQRHRAADISSDSDDEPSAHRICSRNAGPSGTA